MKMMIDTLIEKIQYVNCPVCVGLDTKFDYIPKPFLEKQTGNNLQYAAKSILDFNTAVIDAVADVVPAVKVQAAYYEMYGPAGVGTFYETMRYAKQKGLIVIADVKRNDIGSTAAAYSAAYLSGADVSGEKIPAFDADFITVNPYLGTDGIKPFVDDCTKTGKGIFILVKTSNPSSGEFQDISIGGQTLYEKVADKVDDWGAGLIGAHGYSSIGAVVGATYPKQAKALRERMKHAFFLVPGYGAQGAKANDIAAAFDSGGQGAIVNSSRGILLAYQKDNYSNDFAAAAREAALDMKEDISGARGAR